MSRIVIILKPTNECNFRCKYCYHADTEYTKGRMSIDLFEEIVGKTVQSYNEVTLTFHGGEPLLMGYDFYEKALCVINKYRSQQCVFRLGIQTNGYFLNERFCELFQANKVIPAISYDGPSELNCLRDKTDDITSKIIDLRKKGYHINLLGVITKRNITELSRCYEFAKSHGCHIKMNPVFQSGAAKIENDFLITAEEYIEALKNIIPQWLMDENSTSNTEPMSSLALKAIAKRGKSCSDCGCLTKWISIYPDGTMYPCGRSYPKSNSLGNIRDIEKLSKVFEHPNFIKLLKGSIERRSYCYDNCSYYSICQGGCNNDALLNGDITKPNNFTCQVYENIIPFIQNFIEREAHQIKNQEILELLKMYSYGKHSN